MPSPAEISIEIPFGTLTGFEWGSPDAPPLLALHGWMDNAASFTSLAPLLAQTYRVIALDMPGHGHASHLPDNLKRYHFIDQMDHIFDAADALGLSQFNLLGHSMGAGIATLMASANPDRIEKMILIDAIGPLVDDGSKTLSLWSRATAERIRRHSKSRLFQSIDEAIKVRIAFDGLQPEEARPIVERNLQSTGSHYTWRSDARLRRTTPLFMHASQLDTLLEQITASTLLFLAQPFARHLPPQATQQHIQRFHTIQVEYVHGPHHLHIRHPELLARKIASFLQEQTPALSQVENT